MLIHVHPPHMPFSTALSGPGGDAPRPVVRNRHDVALMFVVCGVACAALSAIVLLLHAHAWSLRDRLGLDTAERPVTRDGLLRWRYNVGIGLSSAALALLVFGIASRRHLRRRLAASEAA